MPLYERSNLPAPIARNIAELKKQKTRCMRIPRWLEDEKVRSRILEVYSMYIARHSIPEIIAKVNVSVTQIYKDIGRAREMRKVIFLNELENMLMEQVEARRQIIQEARTSMELLRQGSLVTIPARPDSNEEEQTLEERSPQRSRAEADLLRVISEQEKAIEELVGLRDRDRILGLPELPLPSPTVTVIVDVKNQTLNVSKEVPEINAIIKD